MRLKKIPKGTRFIKFTNNTEKDCLVYLNKQLFKCIPRKTFHYFHCVVPSCDEVIFYSNIKIEVEYDENIIIL